MAPKILLRIAAFLMVVHTVGHTIGQSRWKKSGNPIQQEVIRQMTGHQFMFMGARRSFGDYYSGYANASTVALLVFAVTLVMIAGQLNTTPLARNLALFTALALIAWSGIEFRYFFPFAAFTTLAAALCTFTGWIITRPLTASYKLNTANQ